MTFKDASLKKDPQGIKCRLDNYDQDRLELLAEQTGMPLSVLARDLIIEGLDRAGIDYAVPATHIKHKEKQVRMFHMSVDDRIRDMAKELNHGSATLKKLTQQ